MIDVLDEPYLSEYGIHREIDMNNNSGICPKCNQYKNELFPVFIEGRTQFGKCEYLCKECLRMVKNSKI